MKNLNMMSKVMRLWLLASLWITLQVGPMSPVLASEEGLFSLSVSEDRDRITVRVAAEEAQDAYAWELIMSYDPLRLEWLDAEASLSGFTVEPIHQASQVRFAHTSVGDKPGHNGNIELARFGFKRIRGGAATIELEQVKLVDSKLDMEEYSPGTNVVITSAGAVKSFSDLSGHWSEQDVMEAVELGFVSGYADGTFRPDQPVTREEVTALLVRALLAEERGEPDAVFADQDHIAPWVSPYVQIAVQQEWIHGYGDGTFRGKQAITRQELAAMLARALSGSEDTGTVHVGILERYNDYDRLSPWARESTTKIVEAGIIQGRPGNTLDPLGTTSRAEAVTMILRMLRAAL